MSHVLFSQVMHGFYWVTMQTIEEFAGSLCPRLSVALFTVIFNGCIPDLFQKLFFTFSQKKDLNVSKVSQWLGRFSSADASLMATQSSKQALDDQIILWQAWDVVAVQQVVTKQLSTLSKSIVKGTQDGLVACLGSEVL
jgi:hypothetical protein